MSKESALYFAKMSAEALMMAKHALLSYAREVEVDPANCPLLTGDGDHYEISRFLMSGGIEWNCPLCNERFTI